MPSRTGPAGNGADGLIREQSMSPFRFIPRDRFEPVPDTYWGRVHRVATLGEGVGVFLVEFHDGVPHRTHRHPKHAEALYILSGAIRQTIDHTSHRTLAAGDAVEIGRGRWHSATPLEPNTSVLVVLSGDGNEYESEEESPPPSGAHEPPDRPRDPLQGRPENPVG